MIKTTIDEYEVSLYKMARVYHGFYENVAVHTRAKAAVLRQSLNPYYHERGSFITRTALFFAAWLRFHPRSGVRALHEFIQAVMVHAPTAETQSQVRLLEQGVAVVKNRIDGVQDAIDEIPTVRLECRELVKKRRRKSGR